MNKYKITMVSGREYEIQSYQGQYEQLKELILIEHFTFGKVIIITKNIESITDITKIK